MDSCTWDGIPTSSTHTKGVFLQQNNDHIQTVYLYILEGYHSFFKWSSAVNKEKNEYSTVTLFCHNFFEIISINFLQITHKKFPYTQ